MELEQEIGDLLRQRGLTLGAVESATGGLLSHLVTDVPGSSDYYKGSVTAYSNETKIKVVGVKAATLEQHGAVSAQVAEEMALRGSQALAVDICLADTGIAGPSGATPGKPVGLFYLGLAHHGKVFSQRHEFHGDREQNKQCAAEAALRWLQEYLTGLESV
jgi:nicotinamide-nucleotide amidase